MAEKKTLTASDYLHMPQNQLLDHPNYSPHAMRVVVAFTRMTTEQLEELNLKPNGRKK